VTPASFALVSDEAGAIDVGIELVLGDGRKRRIRQGVDEATSRSVLALWIRRDAEPSNGDQGVSVLTARLTWIIPRAWLAHAQV
jgi:hypothetical protein